MSCKQTWTSLTQDDCESLVDQLVYDGYLQANFSKDCPQHSTNYTTTNVCNIPMSVYESSVVR